MSERPEWVVSIDETILNDLREHRADYPALIASRNGLHLDTVVSRCKWLSTHGFLERISDEAVYRITERGTRHVAENRGNSGLESVR